MIKTGITATGMGPDGAFTIQADLFFFPSVKDTELETRRVVVLGKVTEGTVPIGAHVTFAVPGKTETITDGIFEIQVDKQNVKSATVGQEIGIALKETTMPAFERFNRPTPVKTLKKRKTA